MRQGEDKPQEGAQITPRSCKWLNGWPVLTKGCLAALRQMFLYFCEHPPTQTVFICRPLDLIVKPSLQFPVGPAGLKEAEELPGLLAGILPGIHSSSSV